MRKVHPMNTIAIFEAADNPPQIAGAMDARLRRALELRLHELQRRLPTSLTPCERREMADLKEVLGTKEEDRR
jgi:hypothetical protein